MDLDASSADAEPNDGAIGDVGVELDAASTDLGSADTGETDAGDQDGGRRDGGGRDGGGRDGGGRDLGPVDGATGLVPLDELGTGTHQGFEGGFYPGGSNTLPAAHAAEGLARALAITPRDGTGAPSGSGRYVLLSIGMSNATQEFCSSNSQPPCDAWTFMGQAAVEPGLSGSLVIANGARANQTAAAWTSSTSQEYNRIRDNVLAPAGLTEAQVEIAWVKLANANPTLSLPDPNADAFTLLGQAGQVMRALKARYPNLTMVFVSSRIFAGYANTTLNPEPYAYEQAFAMKWLIEAQIQQAATGVIDPRTGDLSYGAAAPWIDFGPYLWADGPNPRASDGLTWEPRNFQNDGTHPSRSGEGKVGDLLLAFFTTSPLTRCWFMTGLTCP